MLTTMSDDRSVYLQQLTPSQCRAHCFLAALGVLESPAADVWRRAAEAPLVDLFGPEWELLTLLHDTRAELSEEATQRLHLCILWRYFRGPGVARFHRPEGEQRLIGWLAAQLRRPQLGTAAEVEAELAAVYESIWEAIVRRVSLGPAVRERALRTRPADAPGPVALVH
ncbi:MAG TPA: hypothetical protein VFU47_13865 [Armatimonadota bacterium]|nr:hypothetical protein [Armatimonadota bacterium]